MRDKQTDSLIATGKISTMGVSKVFVCSTDNIRLWFTLIRLYSLRSARHRKGLLPTPKRSPLTSSSPSQRISAAAASTPVHVNPPVTTPPVNPSLPYPIPSTVAGYVGSHAHTYTTSFTATAPVQNTVIVQQPGQSVYVQQQVRVCAWSGGGID